MARLVGFGTLRLLPPHLKRDPLSQKVFDEPRRLLQLQIADHAQKARLYPVLLPSVARRLPLVLLLPVLLGYAARPLLPRLLNRLVLPLLPRAELVRQRVVVKRKKLHQPVLPHKVARLVAPDARVRLVVPVFVMPADLYFWHPAVRVLLLKVIKLLRPLCTKQHCPRLNRPLPPFLLYPVLLVVARL